MNNFTLKLRCKVHSKQKILGVCYNTSCSKGPLYCVDCLTLDHSNHLQDTINISDLESRLEQLIVSILIDNKIAGSLNYKSDIQEVIKDIRIQQQQLEEKNNESINLNNLNNNRYQNELQIDFEKDEFQILANYESIMQQKIQCDQCKQNLEQSEIKSDEKNKICKCCLGLKCSKCQKFFNQPLQKIENEIYCQECIKCFECNKQKPRQMSGSFFYHDECLLISQNSLLKKEMIACIKKYFGTKQKKGDNNDKIKFQSEPYPCIKVKDYLGCIIGYNHPLTKSKTPIDPKAVKITQEQADNYLNEDLDQFESELSEFYLRKGKKLEDIPENIRMLMLFVLFIFKDFQTVLNLAHQLTYSNLYIEITRFKYPQDTSNVLRGKMEKALDFFNDRFHREDGRIREKTMFNAFKQYLPRYKRN